ncbi:MAG: 8-oxoguanine DNA glycosylase [Firmicutes bacterium]|nr:8-oxoguanine DNA glycosylase [Bacillota bacterium]
MAVVIENVKDFNTDHIFDCGQCFRFEKEEDGSWTGTAFDRMTNVRFEPYGGADPGDDAGPGRLVIESADDTETEALWRSYFDLDRDYGAIKKELAERDPVIEEATRCGYGIRILKQDPWETALSFIISQNNNIPRIKKCIESVAANFGDKIGEFRGRTFFSLPSAGKLAQLEETDLGCCRLGYRAKYIIETAKVLAEDKCRRLNELASEEVSSEEAFEYISELAGVGPKVANCILLFGLSKYDRFPIDVWMKRVMSDLYGYPENDLSAMADFAGKTYGKWGGIAQQYLFYFARSRGDSGRG